MKMFYIQTVYAERIFRYHIAMQTVSPTVNRKAQNFLAIPIDATFNISGTFEML